MSRAVLRKRKRLSKLQLSTIGKNAAVGLPQADDSESDPSADEADNVDSQDDGYVSDDNEEDVTSENVAPRIIEQVFNVAELGLIDILHLKDVDDLTAPEKGTLLMSKLFYPTSCSDVFQKYWEKRAIVCQSENAQHFKKLISRKTLEGTIGKQLLFENAHISFFIQSELIATYKSKDATKDGADDDGDDNDQDGSDVEEDDENHRREVSAAEVWRKYKAGYSVRLLTPQMYHDGVWKLLSVLEHVFNCRVSGEAVLTPLAAAAKSSKTTPKDGATTNEPTAVAFDNANAIVVQLEGHSRWRASPNPHADQKLALQRGAVALKDIDQWSKPEIDVTLGPGGTLYIPKGWVYQQDNNGSPSGEAVAGGDGHSLHLRITCNHGTTATMADLLEVVVPQALAEAVQSRAELRAALPRHYVRHLGVAWSEVEGDVQRERLSAKIASLLRIITDKAMDILDPAADQLVKQFIAGRLPVPLSPAEEACTAAGAPLATIFPYTQLRMLRPGIATAVVEDGKVVVYHCMDNSREPFGHPLSPLEFELDDGLAIEALLTAYPDAVAVSDLEHPGEELDDKVAIAQALYKEGFLVIADEVSKPAVPVPQQERGRLEGKAGSAKKQKKTKSGDSGRAKPLDNDDDPF